MPRFPWSVSRWGSLLFVVVLSIAGAMPAASAHAQSQYEIAIVVLPPTEQEPETLADMGSTMSAFLNASGSAQSTGPAVSTSSLDLNVIDAQGSDQGWIIKLMQPDSPGEEESQDYDAFLLRAKPVHDQRSVALQGIRGDWFSVGQPLDRMTPILRAEQGTVPATHHVRFDVAGQPAVAMPLVVSLSTAP